MPRLGFHDLGWYEFLYLILLVVPSMAWLGRKRRRAGSMLVAFTLLYVPVRFALDFLRVSDVRYGGLTPAQWAGLIMLAAVITLWSRTRMKKGEHAVQREDGPKMEELSRLLGHLESRLTVFSISVSSDAREDEVRVAKSLLRVCYVQAAATYTLGRSGVAEAAVANLRTLFEAWVDLRFLLLHGDPVRNARKCIAYGYLEVLGVREQSGDDDQDLHDLRAAVEKIRLRDVDAFEEVKTQRESKDRRQGRHWSGLTRSALIAAVGDRLPPNEVGLRGAYKVLSWDAHNLMSAVRDVREVEVEGQMVQRHGYWLEPSEAAEENAQLATRMLADAWTVVATHYDLGLP